VKVKVLNTCGINEALEQTNLEKGSLVLGFINEQMILADLDNCGISLMYSEALEMAKDVDCRLPNKEEAKLLHINLDIIRKYIDLPERGSIWLNDPVDGLNEAYCVSINGGHISRDLRQARHQVIFVKTLK